MKIKSDNARLIEDGQLSGSKKSHIMEICD